MAAVPATDQRRPVSWGTGLALALSLAAFLGLGEGLFRLFEVKVEHNIIHLPLDVIWMAPLANLLWVVVPAALFILIHRLAPSRLTLPILTAVITTLAVFSAGMAVERMAKISSFLIALGCGIQAGRMVARRPEGLPILLRRVLPVLWGIVLLLALGRGGWRKWTEHQALAAVPAASPDHPNVLLLVLDTVRGLNLSLYGYPRPTTPHLEQWAKRGTVFDRAISPAPWTLPSHASMFTGEPPRALSTTLKAPLDRRQQVMAEAFAAAGYATGGFAANMSYCSREHGLSRGFAHYQDYPLSWGTVLHSSGIGHWLFDQPWARKLIGYHELLWRKHGDQVAGQFLDWQAGLNGRPFFAFLNWFDAHQPFLPPADLERPFLKRPDLHFTPRGIIAKYKDMSAEEIAYTEDQYDALLAWQDQAIDRMLTEMDRRGLLENTIVVITSDHGEHFGEHERVSHGNSLYWHLIQVPLVIIAPNRVPADRRVAEAATLRDLPATLTALAGVAPAKPFPGRSLARLWDGSPPADTLGRVVMAEMPGKLAPTAHSIVLDRYHYVRWFEHAPELYDVDADPQETTDLATNPADSVVMRSLTALAAKLAAKGADSTKAPTSDEGVVDETTVDKGEQ